MSENESVIESIQGLESLSISTNKEKYEPYFSNHINRMMSIDYLANGFYQNPSTFIFNMDCYNGLTQSAFENSNSFELQEPNEVDLNVVDDNAEIVITKLDSLLSEEANSDYLKPFKIFTRECVSNYFIYQQMHKKTIMNPWLHTLYMIKNGFIFLATDKKEILTEYKKDMYSKVSPNTEKNLGILVKNKSKKLGGYILDERHKIQIIVHKFLFDNAKGHENLKTLDMIKAFLDSKSYQMKKENIQQHILTPLKKTGTVGSSGQGYFYLNSKEDFILSCQFHRTKIASMEKIIKVYSQLSGKFDNFNLSSECKVEED